jgi:hypothetical protein
MEEQLFHGEEYRFTDTRRVGLYYYFSLFIWPFGIMLAALRHWKSPWSKNVFWLFCIFMGLTYVIAEEGGNDSDRLNRQFISFVYSDLSFSELWDSFYSEGTKYADIASPLIIYFVSRITHNPSILFAVFGLIFGYFYSRNIWYILDRLKGNIVGVDLLFILTMGLLNPLWSIGNFRFFLAAHIFLYGTLPYFLEKNHKRLIMAALSVFIHWSFVFPVAVFILFVFLKNRLNLYFSLFIFSAFIKELDLEMVKSILLTFLPDFLPEVYDIRVMSYANTSLAESISIENQGYAWYIPYSDIVIKWVVYAFIIYVYFYGKEILKEIPRLAELLCFSLLLYGLGNIFSLVPSGERFIMIANTFLFPFIILFMNAAPIIKGLTLLRYLSIPALLLYCIVELRVGTDSFGLMTLIGNPLFATLYTDRVPLIEEIKGFLLL